jgi:hypothetical protein
MKKTLETSFTPGLVLMISNAGRMVCWVVCTAPETMPSASPCIDHHGAEIAHVLQGVARHLLGDALVLAQLEIGLRVALAIRGGDRVDDGDPSSLSPSSPIRRRIFSGSPSRVRSTT